MPNENLKWMRICDHLHPTEKVFSRSATAFVKGELWVVLVTTVPYGAKTLGVQVQGQNKNESSGKHVFNELARGDHFNQCMKQRNEMQRGCQRKLKLRIWSKISKWLGRVERMKGKRLPGWCTSRMWRANGSEGKLCLEDGTDDRKAELSNARVEQCEMVCSV